MAGEHSLHAPSSVTERCACGRRGAVPTLRALLLAAAVALVLVAPLLVSAAPAETNRERQEGDVSRLMGPDVQPWLDHCRTHEARALCEQCQMATGDPLAYTYCCKDINGVYDYCTRFVNNAENSALRRR